MGCPQSNTAHFVCAQFPGNKKALREQKAECGVTHYVTGSLQGLSLFQNKAVPLTKEGPIGFPSVFLGSWGVEGKQSTGSQ